jgi:Tfp pilus assembly PilM family ATPase
MLCKLHSGRFSGNLKKGRETVTSVDITQETPQIMLIIVEMILKSKVPSLAHIKVQDSEMQSQLTVDCQVIAKLIDREVLPAERLHY